MIGHRINNYEVKALLGEGGMGSVYMAEHPVLGRRTAIKVLRREFADNADLVSRFINEARAASAIRHPGIIEVFDVGTLLDGLPYLMMELLEGETLARCLEREGRLPVSEAVELFRQAASALAAAHEHGIIHRDLKPENLFLVGGGRQRRVKILDFGIAKLHRNLGGARAVHTHTGSVMGTPQYMSPEQCRGISGEIDHRTDIYALGVILHEMLAGAPPFASEGYGDLLIMHLTVPPPRLRAIDPHIPPAVEACVLRALEKTRDRRFASVDEMARAIADAAARPTARDGTDLHRGGSEATLPPWIARPSSPELRRHTTFSATNGQMEAVGGDDGDVDLRPRRRRVVVGTFIAVALGVTVAVGLATRPWDPATPVPSSAGAPPEPVPLRQVDPPAPAEPAASATETTATDEPPAAQASPDAGAPAVAEEAKPPPSEERAGTAPAAGARPSRDRRRPARAASSSAAAAPPSPSATGNAASGTAGAAAAAGGASGAAAPAAPASPTPPPPAAIKTEKW